MSAVNPLLRLVVEPGGGTLDASVASQTQLTLLTAMRLGLRSLPREIGLLTRLRCLDLAQNRLEKLPRELGLLPALSFLDLCSNLLCWLPLSLDRLPAHAGVYLAHNNFAIEHASPFFNWRPILADVLATTSEISMVRLEATEICIGLQELELPALVTLEIIDAAFPNAIPMICKWELVCAVKHFHQRSSAR